MALLLLSGCEKDKEDEPSTSSIAGKWTFRTYEYAAKNIDGSIVETKSGTFPADTYADLQKDGIAHLKLSGQSLRTRWSVHGEGALMKLSMPGPNGYVYPDPNYYVIFPVAGFDVMEQTSSRLVLFMAQHYGVGINEEQTLVLEK